MDPRRSRSSRIHTASRMPVSPGTARSWSTSTCSGRARPPARRGSRTWWSPTPTAPTRRSSPTAWLRPIRCGRLTGGGSATPRWRRPRLCRARRRLAATDRHRFLLRRGTPSWSPDSVRLAVAAGDRDLWLVNRDGTDAHRISRGDYARVGEKGSNADWSPDGTQLLFGAVGAGEPVDLQHSGLYVVGLDGAPERLISPCANNGVWSPDGSLLAYVRCGTGVGPSPCRGRCERSHRSGCSTATTAGTCPHLVAGPDADRDPGRPAGPGERARTAGHRPPRSTGEGTSDHAARRQHHADR